ncbi:MAG: hypothetical protein WBB67_09175 [bacterium]
MKQNSISLLILLLLLVLPAKSIYAADTVYCKWHAAYFDLIYVNWYGDGDSLETERYLRDVMIRSYVSIRLDSLLKALNNQGRLKDFKRWTLIDDPHLSYQHFGDSDPGDINIEDSKAFLCFADSIAINKSLKELWKIEGIKIDSNKKCGMWLFSLHLGTYKDQTRARQLPDTVWISQRPDSNLVWLSVEKNLWVCHAFYQHETDGYYHRYIGLYLTRQDVIKAQKLLFEQLGWKTTITSQYITPSLLRKYISD